MILPDWHRELDAPGYELFMRSTPVFRGTVIVPPHKIYDGEIRDIPDGPIPTDSYLAEGEFSPRRYSVVRQYPGSHFELLIGSVAYTTPFDSEDIAEPFRKFLAREFTILYRVPVTKTYDMDAVSDWDGSFTQLRERYGVA